MEVFSWEDLLKQPDVIPYAKNGTGITVGCFDGFHLGHQKIFDKLTDFCKKNELVSGVITFGKQITSVKSSNEYSGYLTKSEDFSLIKKYYPEVKFCIVIDFTPEFAKMSGEEFFLKLKKIINLKYIAEGTDFRCGYKGSMGMNEIKDFGTANSITCDFIQPVFLENYSEERISSSLIRKCIYEGKLSIANQMLGYNYQLDFSDLRFNFDSENKVFFIEKTKISQILPEKGEFLVQSENKEEKLVFTEKNIYCTNDIKKAVFIAD